MTMKKVFFTFLLALACATLPMEAQKKGKVDQAAKAWSELYPEIEKSIKAPEFRDKDYPVFKYGKKSKTKGYLYTQLINKVIDRCSREGGGRVVIPAGTWLTGPITLKSNVNLYLEEGATLLFTSDLKEYPLVLTRWEGMDCYNYQPMFSCSYA